MADGVWAFMDIEGIKPTNNAAERALRQSVIQRKISHGVQSRQGAICRSRLLTVTTTLRQQGRDVWQFLVTWTPKTEPALMRASLPARLGQEKPHETQAPHPRTDHPQAADR